MGVLMDETSDADLGRMYKLFCAVDGVQDFLDGWSRYVEVCFSDAMFWT